MAMSIRMHASSSRLARGSARPAARALVVPKAMLERHDKELSPSRGSVKTAAGFEETQTFEEEASLWGALLHVFRNRPNNPSDMAEEYGPYAHEIMSPKRGGDMYHSHICERLAMEGPGSSH